MSLIGCQNVWLSECRWQGVRGAGERPLSHTDVLSTLLSVREFKIRGIVGWVENAAVHILLPFIQLQALLGSSLYASVGKGLGEYRVSYSCDGC